MTLKITQAAREAAADCCPKELYELCGCYGSGVSGSSGFPCSDCGGSGGFPPDWLVQAFQRAMNQAADEALERAVTEAEWTIELRRHLFGGEPLNPNESAIVEGIRDAVLDAIRALKGRPS